MKQIISKLLIGQIIISAIFFTACSSDFAFVDRDIRYLLSKINTANKKSIVLQDGTVWGFGHFSINTPGNEVIITYYESSLGGTAYINGIEKSVSYVGTAYDGAGSVNDILQFNEGRLSNISSIDSSGTYIALDDSSNWIVRPDQRSEVKKWQDNETIIRDNGKQFIINTRTYQMAAVQEVKKEVVK